MKVEDQNTSQIQKKEFAAFIKDLADKYQPLQIYCFGEFMESANKRGCFIESAAHENYQYYLLMVIESATRIENHVQDYANHHFPYGTITILVHGKETITEAVRANNRFFITVANSGKLLYSADPTIKSFRVPDFIPTRAAEKAKKHYRRRMALAAGFLESAMECLRKGNYHLCVFMLHQVVEQCCICMIRVHLAYRSDIHNLYRLLRLCDSFSPAMSGLFLGEGEEGRRLFELMVSSYSAARYKDDFVVEQPDAERLYNQVAAFLKVADVLCQDKIEALALDAEVYRQLKTESEVCYG
ncbi:HEPN domain-containing protein [Pedobacter westerhofensis]|uniref:HEPN domain-containing protein n=1 Tax=Pedobacter westerhofensis TaxID=425512 RepID=A0A521FQT4_9SPHI|nr:HEPN domain-containing protein [Pedobacter westerhofensis]SMO98553.1 HEPN domain-containing protein [Pedobacter westerhofensis]